MKRMKILGKLIGGDWSELSECKFMLVQAQSLIPV